MIQDTPGGIVLAVKVVPRAGRSMVAGTRDGAVLVKLAAAPVEGAANNELLNLLADFFDVPKRHLTILSGEKSRQKRVKIIGVALDDARRRLDDAR